MRNWVCTFQFLSGIASTAFLRSESHETQSRQSPLYCIGTDRTENTAYSSYLAMSVPLAPHLLLKVNTPQYV
jgi:hypothetical protein